jgi:hypothetical protein
VNLTNLAIKIKVGARQHVVQQLLTNPEDLASYQQLVVELLFTSVNIISTDNWSSYARPSPIISAC